MNALHNIKKSHPMQKQEDIREKDVYDLTSLYMA